MLEKNKKYFQLSKRDVTVAEVYMAAELVGLPKAHPIRQLFNEAWSAYKLGKYAYDGATFVQERHKRTIFEVAALVHDWRNSNGFVGEPVDQEMFDIMIRLNYPLKLIIERYRFTRWTWVNKLRHLCKGTYSRTLPENLYELSNY